MKKILIHTDHNRSKQLTTKRKVHLEDLNEILSEYNKLGLDELTGNEFQELISNPKSVVFDKINNGEAASIGGLPINKHKALELVTMPAGFHQLEALIESFKRSRSDYSTHLCHVDIVDNEVVIKQCVIDADIEAGKIYLQTEKEKTLFDFLEGVISLANEKFGKRPYDLGNLISSKISFNNGPGQPLYKIKYSTLKGFGEAQ